jgi:glutathione-regulated potassium-efflux system ancillary protein KefG
VKSNRILILFAHPVFERSRVHRALVQKIRALQGVTLHDLYELYPEFDIDIEREKELLANHDIIIWQHPLFWYSGPALLKQWQDLVLEHGWAYGKEGHALDGKKIFNSFTSGGEMQAYQNISFQGSSIKDFFLPFERTAQLCRMVYLPPFWVPGTHRLDKDHIDKYCEQYAALLTQLVNDKWTERELLDVPFLNNLVESENHK